MKQKVDIIEKNTKFIQDIICSQTIVLFMV